MTHTLYDGNIFVDLGISTNERIASSSNLQVMPFPTQPSKNADVFDYSGVERRVSVRGVFANATMAETTLAADSDAYDPNSNYVATSLIVPSGGTDNFASSGTLLIEGEYITYTSKTSTGFYGCTRGKYNTQGKATGIGTRHLAGAYIVQNPAAMLHALETGAQSSIKYVSPQLGTIWGKVEKVETDLNAGAPTLIGYSFELVESSTIS